MSTAKFNERTLTISINGGMHSILTPLLPASNKFHRGKMMASGPKCAESVRRPGPRRSSGTHGAFFEPYHVMTIRPQHRCSPSGKCGHPIGLELPWAKLQVLTACNQHASPQHCRSGFFFLRPWLEERCAQLQEWRALPRSKTLN